MTYKEMQDLLDSAQRDVESAKKHLDEMQRSLTEEDDVEVGAEAEYALEALIDANKALIQVIIET